MGNESNSETVRIDKLLSEAYAERKDLKAGLSKVDRRIKTLLETKAMLTGQVVPIKSKEQTIPDALEEILKTHGKAHCDELKVLLEEKGVFAAKQTISGALIRYANQGRRFKRVGKNTFALLEKKG